MLDPSAPAAPAWLQTVFRSDRPRVVARLRGWLGRGAAAAASAARRSSRRPLASQPHRPISFDRYQAAMSPGRTGVFLGGPSAVIGSLAVRF